MQLTLKQLKAFNNMPKRTEGFEELSQLHQKKVLAFVLCNQSFLN
ncbi:hypothetical protein [Halalkalibacter nanhaiisediminis]|uniref:Uncharacterized protein n=1 Tax=Halalkalibacter nanhaiisediminis TaxID=688079 RepID=A0A562QT03_9BACI|nr:hypothetical protein [Halalkalibacter nanhaiisediminis]TWI59901.1 hypothetical protein IQ10_00324 [Halalkalibacter nanhaiisediminis]